MKLTEKVSWLIERVQENLRRICGFMNPGDIPPESTFSRAFAEFAASSLGNREHDALVEHYLSAELVGPYQPGFHRHCRA